MSNLPEGVAQFEFHRMQLISHLDAVADSMRKCATVAEHFAQVVTHLPANANGVAPTATTAKGKRKSQALEDGDGKKVRRKREPKDPHAPKRPASSYLLFQNEVLKELKNGNPDIPHSQLLTIIGQKWSELPEEARQAYTQKVTMMKEQYKLDKAEYDKKLATGATHADFAAAAAAPVASATTRKPKAAAAPPKSAAVVQTSSDSSDDSASGGESSSEEQDEEEEQEAVQPPAKRAKKAASPVVTKQNKKATRA